MIYMHLFEQVKFGCIFCSIYVHAVCKLGEVVGAVGDACTRSLLKVEI